MRPLFRRLLAAAFAAGPILLPTLASAVTVDEIIALAHAGVTDTVILGLIDRDRTIFTLQPEQLVELKNQGLSETVILAMLRSGREEGDRAAQAESDLKTAMYLAERSPGPEVVVIGHGPDTPNAWRANEFSSAPPAAGFYAVPYLVGSGNRRGRARAAQAFKPSGANFSSFPSAFHDPVVPPTGAPVIPPVSLSQQAAPLPRMLCRAAINTATSAAPLTTIVECPPIMQPGRR